MTISASIPIADMAAVNADLDALGFGPSNFNVPTYGDGNPTHASLHCWDDTPFLSALVSLQGTYPGLVLTNDPGEVVNFSGHVAANSLEWLDNVPELEGNVSPGIHRSSEDYWFVIQAFDRDVFDQDPLTYPALMRRARVPGEIYEWRQPIDQFDAYKLSNPFTGSPDRVTHNGNTWEVSDADGSGNNIWEPGVFGWVQV